MKIIKHGDLELLKKQEAYMWEYIKCLDLRAEIEGIDLTV